MDILKVGGSLRALRKERFLVWLQLFSEDIESVKIILPKNVKLEKFLNYSVKKPKYNPPKKMYIIERQYFGHPDQASFFFSYNGNDINVEPIKFIAKNSKNEEICTKSFKINILIPEIEVHASIDKTLIKSKSGGFIKIKVNLCNDAVITIKKIDLILLDHNTKEKILLNKREMTQEEFIELIEKLPPEINPDEYIGKIIIPRNRIIDFQVKIEYYDLMDNVRYQISNLLELPKELIKMGEIFNPLSVPTIQQIKVVC